MDQLILTLRELGAEITKVTHLDCTSIIVGMVIFEIPAIIRRVFGRFRGHE